MTKSSNESPSKLTDLYLKFKQISMGKSSLVLAIGWTALGIANYLSEPDRPKGFAMAQIIIGVVYFLFYFTRTPKSLDN